MVGLAPKWVRLAPNGTNPGTFQIRFHCIWRGASNALKSDLKKPRICPIWGQSDPIWSIEPNVLKSDMKKSRICPIWGQSDQLWSQTYNPCFWVIMIGQHGTHDYMINSILLPSASSAIHDALIGDLTYILFIEQVVYPFSAISFHK